MKSDPLKLHFYRSSNGIRNFGDELSPLFVEMASNRRVELSNVSNCDIISLGSIFEGVAKKLYQRKLKLNFNPIHVWGTGLIGSKDIKNKIIKNNFKIHAVRGIKTQKKIGTNIDVFCDPGLLAGRLIKDQRKKNKILIMPHISHHNLPEIAELHRRIKGSVIADLSQDPIEILKLISSSDLVLSSSLHGLICADSFGIPNIRLKVSMELKGGDFKFNDYYSSIGRTEVCIKADETEQNLISLFDNFNSLYQNNIESLCDNLLKSFPNKLK